MQIEMSRISIRQECVEVCEYYHLNPYQMTSAGTVLMVTRDGNALVRCLEESGARASVLGGYNGRSCKSNHKRRRSALSGQTCSG